MKRFFFGNKAKNDTNSEEKGNAKIEKTESSYVEQDKELEIESKILSNSTETIDSIPQTSSLNDNRDDELKKAIDNYTDDDWRKFAKDHPKIVKIITEVSNESPEEDLPNNLADNKENESELCIQSTLINETQTNQESRFSPREIIAKFIESSLNTVGQFFLKIHSKFTAENLKLINEVLNEILESFAYTDNRENSVAIAFAVRCLTEAQNIPSIKEVPNIGTYVTVLTIMIEVVKCIVHISFSNDKQELRNKISKIFE